MEIRDLEIFYTVARTGSMPKAVIEQSKWVHQLAAHSLDGNTGLVTTYAAWRGVAHLARSLSTLLAQLPE